jgi:hypothetical protein
MLETSPTVNFSRPLSGAAPMPHSAESPALDNELLRAHRVASDKLDHDDVTWLAKGFRAYLANKGRIPLERCLRLPANETACQRAIRDYWLRLAWRRVPGELSPWCRSEGLASAVKRFRATKWVRWSETKSLVVAPGGLDEAIFEAFKSHDRIPSTAMQLHNIAQEAQAH